MNIESKLDNSDQYFSDVALVQYLISGNIKPITDDIALQDVKNMLKVCNTSTLLTDQIIDVNSKKYNNHDVMCFTSSTKDIKSQEYTYKLKRRLQGDATDLFMTKILSFDIFQNYTRYIYYVLDYYISLYINEWNSVSIFHLTANDIKIIPLGGNLIRTYINMFLDNVDTLLTRYVSNDMQNDVLTVVHDTKLEQKLSDWDYNIYINPNFSDDIYEKIRTDIITLMIQATAVIKQKMDIDYFIDENIHNMGSILQEHFFSEAITNELDEYFRTVGENFTLDSIITGYQQITKNDIQNIDANNKINKISYIVERDKLNPRRRNYIENNLFYKSISMQPLPPLLPYTSSQSYIGYSDDIKIYAQYVRHNFSLIRLKINNVFQFRDTNTNKLSNVNIAYEIIDIGVKKKQGDNKYIIIDNMLIEMGNKPHDNDINLQVTFNSKNIISKMTIPSIYFYIADIELIILIESLFPWVDKKYAKRIMRLILLKISAYVMYDKYTNIITMQTMLTKFTNFMHIMKMKGVNLIDKIEYLRNEFNYTFGVKPIVHTGDLDIPIIINKNSMKIFDSLVKNYIKITLILQYLQDKSALTLDEIAFAIHTLKPNKNKARIDAIAYLVTTIDYQMDIPENINKLQNYDDDVYKLCDKIKNIIDNLVANNISADKFKLNYNKYI